MRRPRAVTSPVNPSTETAFRQLVRAAVLTRRVMEPYFTRHGLSGAQWGVLRALHRAEASKGIEAGVRVTELSDRLLIRTPSVTGVLTRLEAAGLVRRTVDDADHRARRLRLTPAGRRLVDDVLQGHAQKMESMLVPLDAVERDRLAGLLGRVADHLETLAGRANGGRGEAAATWEGDA